VGSKVIAVVLVAIVVAAGFGYWVLAPKMPSQVATYTTQQTSLLTSSEQAQLTSTSSATLTSQASQWINVGAAQPVSYYLELLESTGAEPYVSLARELRELPDSSNATAVAQIVYLALNATISSRPSGPEVKEALELIIRGGTPSRSDFSYAVPSYNTELQVLYWLASSTQFKRDDTLALAIAMSNGFWVTVGDDQVRNAVKNDTSSLLAFLRETDALQGSMGYFRLEDLPLEAKITLAWTGDESMRHGYGPPIGLIYWTQQRLPLYIYEADTVSVATLIEMRAEALKNGWIQRGDGVESLVSRVEDYFYSFPGNNEQHFNGRTDYDKIVNDQGIMAVHDVDWQWAQHNKGLKFQGDCGTEMTIADAWLKSWGVATVSEWAYTLFTQYGMEKQSHSFIIYYEPTNRVWKAYWKQISDGGMPNWIAHMGGNTSQPYDMFICRPPVIQQRYLREKYFESRTINGVFYPSYWHFQGNMYYQIELTPWAQLQDMLSKGIPTDTMKEWLFYTSQVV
jgi:hypothetical protein